MSEDTGRMVKIECMAEYDCSLGSYLQQTKVFGSTKFERSRKKALVVIGLGFFETLNLTGVN